MTDLQLPRTVKRRKSYAERSGMNSRAIRIQIKEANGGFDRTYEEDQETGVRRRIFKGDEWRHITNEDVRNMLIGQRVIDLDHALEYVTPSTVKWCERSGYLRRDDRGPYWWVTAKAAGEFNLPPVLGCAFPK
jgi:hypothetical protein